jgi:hypothetical protein
MSKSAEGYGKGETFALYLTSSNCGQDTHTPVAALDQVLRRAK